MTLKPGEVQRVAPIIAPFARPDDIIVSHARYVHDEDFRALVDSLRMILRAGAMTAFDLDVAAELAGVMEEQDQAAEMSTI